MKICPECALTNEERFPTCIVCHTSLADIRSTPSADPAHPEHARRALDRRRRSVTRQQLGWASACYLMLIVGTTVFPGLVSDPQIQAMYAAGGAVVVLAVWQDLVGMFLAGLLQGSVSVTLLLCFGPVHLMSFATISCQTLAAMLFYHWIEMIHDANR